MGILGDGNRDDSWLDGNANGRGDAFREVLEKVRADRSKIEEDPSPIYTDMEMGVIAHINTLEEWLTRQINGGEHENTGS